METAERKSASLLATPNPGDGEEVGLERSGVTEEGGKKKKVLSKSSPPKLPDLQATRARGSRLAGPCRTSGSKPGMETPAASAPGCCSGAPRGPLPRGLTNFGKWGGAQRSCEVGPGAEGAPPAAPGRPRSRVSRADAGGLGRASCPSGHRA